MMRWASLKTVPFANAPYPLPTRRLSPWALLSQPEGLPSGFPGQPLAMGDFNADGIDLFSAAAKAVMRWEALKMVHLADALYGLV